MTDSNDSPTAYVVIDGKRVPFDRAAALRMAENASLLERSLGTRPTKEVLKRRNVPSSASAKAHSTPPRLGLPIR